MQALRTPCRLLGPVPVASAVDLLVFVYLDVRVVAGLQFGRPDVLA